MPLGMVKPQAAASGKAAMICTGEHISTPRGRRRPDQRSGRSGFRRHEVRRRMQWEQLFLRAARNGSETISCAAISAR
jgi:hypothetical protein